MTFQPSIFEERDTAIAQVATNAGQNFISQAMRHAVNFLKGRDSASGEEITDSCREAGIAAHDDRAMGAVLRNLSKDKLIVKAGFCQRKKGHLTSGGNLWRLAAKPANLRG